MSATCRQHEEVVQFGEPSRPSCGPFEALRAGQDRYLEVLRTVAGTVDHADDQGPDALEEAVASHVRLTRQFFAAQRSLLAQRATTSRTVVQVIQQADADAAATLAAAADMAALHGVRLDDVVAAHMPAGQPLNELTWDVDDADRLDLAALGDGAGVDDLVAHDVEAVFARREAFDAETHRQLSSLLDQWWVAEQRECRDLVDDAEARATMRRLVAEVIAADVATQAVASAPLEWSVAPELGMPEPVEPELVAEVGTAVEAVEDALSVEHVDADVICLDGPAMEPCVPVATMAEQPAAADESSELKMLCTRVLLPMMAATGLLIGVLAWVG